VNVAPKALHSALQGFNPPFQCLYTEGKKFYLPKGRTGSDDLVVVLKDQCRWKGATNLDFLAKWIYIDYEFAEESTNMRSFPMRRYSIGPSYFVKEQEGGLESLARRFAEDIFGKPLCASGYLQFSKRVSMIKYDLDQDGYSALITGNQVEGCPAFQYRAKRVVLTTSVGVIANGIATGDLEFIPPLMNPNPLVTKDYTSRHFTSLITTFGTTPDL
jgi:hypothetical protein